MCKKWPNSYLNTLLTDRFNVFFKTHERWFIKMSLNLSFDVDRLISSPIVKVIKTLSRLGIMPAAEPKLFVITGQCINELGNDLSSYRPKKQ